MLIKEKEKELELIIRSEPGECGDDPETLICYQISYRDERYSDTYREETIPGYELRLALAEAILVAKGERSAFSSAFLTPHLRFAVTRTDDDVHIALIYDYYTKNGYGTHSACCRMSPDEAQKFLKDETRKVFMI